MKAYVVFERDLEDEEMFIIFAGSARAARQSAFGMLDCPWTEVRACREPWADAYVDREIPARALLDHDWWLTCYGMRCTDRVDRETVAGWDDRDRPLCVRCVQKGDR